MRGLLLPWIAPVGVEGVIERLAVDVLRMLWKVAANRWREFVVVAVWHRRRLLCPGTDSVCPLERKFKDAAVPAAARHIR
jgi:hypothetical protein